MPDIAETAREWLGTPFHWGASVRGVGCDCKGLVAGVARDCGRPEAQSFEAAFTGYGQRGDPARLAAGMARLFDRVDDMQPGDLLLIVIGGKPHHLGICVGNGRMIHAYIKGPHRVTEAPVRDWKIDSIWRWRDDG